MTPALNTEKIGFYLKDLVDDAQKFIDSDETMIMVSALTIMSSILGNRVHTYNGTRSKLYPNIWSLIIAKSGLGTKSTTLNMVEKMTTQAVIGYYTTIYKNEMTEYKKLPKNEKNEKEPPKMRQLLSGQGSTFQGIIKSLQNSKYGMIAIYDEARELLRKLNKDVENKASLTSLYDKDYYGKDLVGAHGNGISVNINKPFLSILAATNPDWLHDEIKTADYTSGFFNRFIILDINIYAKLKAFKETKQQNFEKFQKCSLDIVKYLDKVHSVENPLALDTALIETIYSDWFDEKLRQYEDSEDHIRSFLLRQLSGALKYALIIQVYDYFYLGKDINTLKTLEVKYMEIGIYLAELFMKHIEAHIEKMNLDDGEFEALKDKNSIENIANKIYNYLHKRIDDDFIRSDLCNNIRNLKASNFDEATEYAMKKYPCITYDKSVSGRKFYIYHILSENLQPKEREAFFSYIEAQEEDPDNMDISDLLED